MKYENQILDAIETIVNNAVDRAGYDRTIQAKIINCEDPTIGKYKVQYQDSIFYVYSNNSEVTYSSGSEVYVLISNNDMSRDKTILGSVNKLGRDYAVAAEGEEAFEVIGTNCVESNNIYELCSYKTTTEYIIYDKNKTDNLLRFNLKNINEYIKSSSSINLAATIKTNLNTEQQFRGNYGIIFEMVFSDNGTEELVTRNYVLDINQFEGNPYKMPNYKKQVGIFEIDGINFQYINKVYLFCYDFPNQDETKPNDIFIKDLEVCGSKPLSAEDLATCSLSFITPQGIYFDDNDLASATRTIQAQVRVKGKYINPISQRLPYYWFIENNGITSLSEDYNVYGGQGWKCLNRKNIVKSGSIDIAPVVEWVAADYQYTVKKSDSDARETKYKCVVIYNDILLSRTFTITNYSSSYEISIESDSGTQFYYDIGNPSLVCKVNGQEQIGNDYEYQWAEVDNNNNFYALSENTMSLTKVNSIAEMTNNNNLYILTTNNCIYYYKNSWINTTITVNSGDNDNDIYNKIVASYTQLEADINAERAMAAASQEQLDAYLTIINKYDKIMRIEGNQIHHLQVNTITNFATYKCSVYHNGVYIGTSSIVIKNDLDKKDVYSLVINNGAQTFKYNEAGISPASNSLDNPQVILPLSFTVYDNLGNALDDEVINKCDYKWLVPIKDTMLEFDNTYPWIPQGDYQMLINELSLQYDIKNKYDINKNNNTIQLIVDYKGMNLVAETDFTFVKEGEPGTNGTEFVCKIVPNTDDINFGYPMVLNGNLNYTPRQTGRWFNVQLWHNGTKIFEGNATANTSENKSAKVEWSILRNKYTTSLYDITSLSVNNGVFSYTGYQGANSPANIVKVTVTYDGINYYATIPVITGTAESGYSIALVENSGFRYATYSADGRKPQYDNSNPFELKVTKVIDGVTEDISTLTQDYAVNYDWNIRGTIYNLINQRFEDSNNLGIYNRAGFILARNQASYKPLDDFNGECLTNGLECIVLNNSAVEVARIHIPIHLLLNKYGNAAINGWDGNSVSIDKNGNGVILAPQIGAGQKETDNSFTGMLMGSVKEAGKNKIDVGMFGYHFGERSLFLNAEDGSAIFGKKGPGQIILDPRTKDKSGNVIDPKAMLYSSGYWRNYDDDGKPSSYSSTNKNNQGMLIDLTTPLIEWGNGNFKIDKDGHITAKGGGTIAGFNIDDDSIFTGTKTSNTNVRLSSANGTFTRTINGTSRNNLNLAISNKFAIDKDGGMYSNSGEIAKFVISDSKLVGGSGNSTIGLCARSGDEYAFWAGAAAGANAPFHVGHDGSLNSTKGVIGGWTINGTELLSNNGNIHITSSGTLKGPNWEINANGNATFNDIKITQSAYGRQDNLIDFNNFKVYNNGNFNATGGEIAGWTVNGEAIYNGKGIGVAGSVGISPSISGWAFWAGNGTFRVDHNGNLYATSGNFTGNINSGSTITGAGISRRYYWYFSKWWIFTNGSWRKMN